MIDFVLVTYLILRVDGFSMEDFEDKCTPIDTDRFEGYGVCCAGLVQKTEPRDRDDSDYCPESDPNHGKSCYSTVEMCRAGCTGENADKNAPDLGGCCEGLVLRTESRPRDDSHYCPVTDKNYGKSCWPTVEMCRSPGCKKVVKSVITPHLEDDDDAEAKCDLHCKHYIGQEWSWDGKWWQHNDEPQSWSHCTCWKNDCDCVVSMEDGIAKYHFERWGCTLGWVTASQSTADCSPANTDRYGGLGACCDGLKEETEDRRTDDPLYCPVTDPNNGRSCWSTIQMCRAADWKGTCSPENSDRYDGLGACCEGLVENEESRQTDDPLYCPESDKNHGKSCWSTIQMCRKDPDLEFGTCVGDMLASCSWGDRNSDYHRTYTATSPKHCGVTQVMFYTSGGAPVVPDVDSDKWMGVKLVDDDNRVVRSHALSHYTKTDDWEQVLWDDLPGTKCYRVVVQDGQVGDWGHIEIQDVQFWSTAPLRMLRDIDSRGQYNDEDARWSETKGDRVLEFDVEWGVDAHGDDYSGLYTIGAEYISKTTNIPTVVTDVFLAVSDYKEVDCPEGYERKAFWDAQRGDSDNWNAKTDITNEYMSALCVKREPCGFGKSYVSLVEAKTGDQKHIASTSENGCKIIGSWNPQYAYSWTSGERAEFTTALYQCKQECPHAQCHSVVMRVLEKTSPEKMEKDSAASGSTISFVKDIPNCVGEAELDYSISLGAGETMSDSSSYHLAKSLQNSFSSTLTNSVSLTAEVGFSAWGVDVSTSITGGISTSKTNGFSETTSSDKTEIHSSSQQAEIGDLSTFTLPAGHIAHLEVELTSIRYSTSFVAVSDCLDEYGEVIETRHLEGVFRGRTFKSQGRSEISTRQCPANKCQCHRVY